MKVYYCDGWFRAKKFAPEMWDEAKARAAHSKRQLYTALLGSASAPSCFVEVTGNSIGVGFLDALLREYLSYNFQERQPGKLFLSMATHRKFDGDSDKVTWGVTYFFDENGHVAIQEQDLIADEDADAFISAETFLDVSANWEPYPQFGEYESITRKGRVELIPIADKKDSLFE